MILNNADEQITTTNIRLVEAHPGQTIMIRHLEGGRSFLARLAVLGFTPGTPLKVMRINDHGPVLIRLRGAQIALGREEAEQIIVSPIQETFLTESELDQA